MSDVTGEELLKGTGGEVRARLPGQVPGDGRPCGTEDAQHTLCLASEDRQGRYEVLVIIIIRHDLF